MSTRQIAYRLKSEGKAELLRDQREVAEGFQRTYAAAETGAAAATTATDRQERRYRAMAQAAREAEAAQASQARFNAALGVGGVPAGSARDSADVFAAQAAAMEDAERRARALRTILDPLGAAQDRLNDELREYSALAAQGRISTAELAQAQAVARRRFDETAAAINRQERGMSRLVIASRMNLARQGADVAVTAAMGMNPAMIAIQQGPQILDAWSTSGIRMTGVMGAAAAGVGLLATATGVLIAAWHSGEAQNLRLERAVSGLGVTSGLTASELDDLARAAAAQGEVSVRVAQDQAIAYLSTGRIGREVIQELIALGKDYSAVFGVDAEEATKALATSMLEPDKAARALTRQMGLLDQKTLDYIDTLVKEGKLTEAQTVLSRELRDALEGQAEKVDRLKAAWDGATRAVSDYWEKLTRALNPGTDDRIASLNLAIWRERRKFGGGSERLISEWTTERDALQQTRDDAARLAREESEERRANQEAQFARDRADAARSARESAARAAASAAERRQREAERQAREALQRSRREEDRESAVRMEVAQLGDNPARIQQLQDEISLLRRIRELEDDGLSTADALNKANAEHSRIVEARLDAAQREGQARADQLAIQEAMARGDHAAVDSIQERLDRQEALNANLRIWKDEWIAGLVTDLEMAAAAERRADAIQRAVDLSRQERDITLARLAGREDEVRRLENAARVRERALAIEDRDRLAPGQGLDQARREVLEELDAEREGVRRAWLKDFVSDIRRGDIRSALAEQFETAADRLLDRLIDGLLEIDWAAFFKGGEGQSGGGAGSWIARGLDWLIGRNADGTDYWRGGLTWVGERGPELINAPRGSQIFDHGRSLRMAAAANAGGGLTKVEITTRLELPPGYVPDRQLVLLLQQAAEVGASEGAKRALANMQAVNMQMQVHKGG